MQLPQLQLNNMPLRRKILFGILILFLCTYLGWLKFGQRAPVAGVPIEALPPKVIASEPVKTIRIPVVVYRDSRKVAEKLGTSAPAAHEEVQTAAKLPTLKYGGTSTVFVNTSSGQSRTVVVPADSPLFAFSRDYAIGVGAGIGTEGKAVAVRYRQDVLQIKRVVLTGELEANYAESRSTPVEGKAMVWLELRNR